MRLIVGLGNPGTKYRDTLHNIGFQALERLFCELSAPAWGEKFQGLYTKGTLEGEGFVLLKPQTFMNLSGKSVLACRQFFKLDLEDVMVLSDDVDMEPGKLRYRFGGGHAGHNGLRDIIQQNGGNGFHRLRFGVGRPQDGREVADYVLSRPGTSIEILLNETIEKSLTHQIEFIKKIPVQVVNSPKNKNSSTTKES